ncbi:hypothetical protein LIA77_03313 [Sarocladium implicatum]|nr:hypothetical protein LIA77_03313 [Sarocladium implicatum]
MPAAAVSLIPGAQSNLPKLSWLTWAPRLRPTLRLMFLGAAPCYDQPLPAIQTSKSSMASLVGNWDDRRKASKPGSLGLRWWPCVVIAGQASSVSAWLQPVAPLSASRTLAPGLATHNSFHWDRVVSRAVGRVWRMVDWEDGPSCARRIRMGVPVGGDKVG